MAKKFPQPDEDETGDNEFQPCPVCDGEVIDGVRVECGYLGRRPPETLPHSPWFCTRPKPMNPAQAARRNRILARWLSRRIDHASGTLQHLHYLLHGQNKLFVVHRA